MSTAKVVLAALAVMSFDTFGVQVSSAPAQESSPTAFQLIQRELSTLPKWNLYLPDDFDTNNDRELSEEEVGEKFKGYMREIFNQLDEDSNQVVIQDEVRKASLNVEFINKVVDIAFKSYPIKRYFGHADRNQDGFISEEDFYLAENNEEMDLPDVLEHCGGDCEYDYGDENGWTLSGSVPVYKHDYFLLNPLCVESMGEKEADVFCRELGYKGVESLSSVSFEEYNENNNFESYDYFEPYTTKLQCGGSESKLEECSKTERNDKEYWEYGGEGYYNSWRNSKEYVCPFGKKLLASVTCLPSDTEMGPIHLAGGKVGSMGELHIGDEDYYGQVDINMATVVCRELGFNKQTPKLMENLDLFDNSLYIPTFGKQIECNGSETKLGDCRQSPNSLYGRRLDWSYSGINCNPGEDLDEKYGRIDHNYFETFWETYGRHVFIADTNEDEKVSIEELKAKAREILEAVFHLLDQTNDGSFSVEDISTLSLRRSDVVDVVNKLFEVVTGDKGEYNPINWLFNMFPTSIIDEIDLEKYPKSGRNTWKELRQHIDGSQDEGLLGLLVKYLDTNQDGLIQSTELENFIKMMFDNLDVDGSSTITLSDIFKFMKESQFTCLQIEGVETFVEGWIELIGTQTEKLLDYFFNYLDLDSNQEISLDEFYNLPVCNQRDQNDPRACRDILGEFFFSVKTPVVPAMKYTARRPTSQREGNEVQEKISNSFCIAMHPAY